MMDIVFYCPDRHLTYDGATADRIGVGGGVTVRIRIAAALVRRGHRVTLICNCSGAGTYEGVRYVPLEAAEAVRCDALAIHSSGGAYDVTGLLKLPVEAKVRVAVLSGLGLPTGTQDLHPDSIYVCSNYLRTETAAFPGVAPEKLFVTYYGINQWNRAGWLPLRDPHRVIYTSHPSKGFDAARDVVRKLRAHDARFTLHCFGGYKLWGGTEQAPEPEAGFVYHGLADQRALAAEYKRSAFAMQMQTRAEPFGITIVEAMAAGAIVIGSPVGSLKELIDHGRTGFLIEGDPAEAGATDRAAAIMWDLCRKPSIMRQIRRAAYEVPMTWDTIAKVWEQHLEWLMAGAPAASVQPAGARCAECGGDAWMRFADGFHCAQCGYYLRKEC